MPATGTSVSGTSVPAEVLAENWWQTEPSTAPYAATAPGARNTAGEGTGIPELALRAELPPHGALPDCRPQPPAAGVSAEVLPLQAVAVAVGPGRVSARPFSQTVRPRARWSGTSSSSTTRAFQT